MTEWVYDDGGRSNYFSGDTGDCVVRAIAIATEQDYKHVYDALALLNKKRYGKKSARNGTNREDIKRYMKQIGWTWHPIMKIGSGCTMHLKRDELPSGRIVCSLSRHLVACVDGVVHDTYDSTRGGTRCVYGYWKREEPPMKPGDVVVYRNGDSAEIGVVKRMRDNDTAFVAYHSGDTCAATPVRCLEVVKNGESIAALAERRKQLGGFIIELAEGCEDWSEQ